MRSLVAYPYIPTSTAAPNKEAALMYTTDTATYNKLCAEVLAQDTSADDALLYYSKESLKRYVDVIARFFRRVMNSNAVTAESMTVENDSIIHRHSRHNHITELKKVLDNLDDIAIINATNAKGNTGLHIACNFGYGEIAKLLFAHGASTSIRNKYGRNPYQCAEFNNQSRILQLFITSFRANETTRITRITSHQQCERTYFNFNKSIIERIPDSDITIFNT